MKDVLPLSLARLRSIGRRSGDEQLLNFIEQFEQTSGATMFIVHPEHGEYDTGEMQAVRVPVTEAERWQAVGGPYVDDAI